MKLSGGYSYNGRWFDSYKITGKGERVLIECLALYERYMSGEFDKVRVIPTPKRGTWQGTAKDFVSARRAKWKKDG
jgi:hypothetical protein